VKPKVASKLIGAASRLVVLRGGSYRGSYRVLCRGVASWSRRMSESSEPEPSDSESSFLSSHDPARGTSTVILRVGLPEFELSWRGWTGGYVPFLLGLVPVGRLGTENSCPRTEMLRSEAPSFGLLVREDIETLSEAFFGWPLLVELKLVLLALASARVVRDVDASETPWVDACERVRDESETDDDDPAG